jgi:hypothetical protein
LPELKKKELEKNCGRRGLGLSFCPLVGLYGKKEKEKEKSPKVLRKTGKQKEKKPKLRNLPWLVLLEIYFYLFFLFGTGLGIADQFGL